MNKMKSFFSFTRHEQTGIMMLIALIIIVIIINFFIRETPPNQINKEELAQWEQTVKLFQEAQETALKQNDSLRKVRKQLQSYYSGSHFDTENTYHSHSKSVKKLPTPFSFNPNDADKQDFIKLGFSEKQAESIIKYRSKGASFKNKSDFQKVFVVSDEMFNHLEAWILLPDNNDSITADITESPENITENIIIELNSTDTTELKKIKYIGSVLAKRIINYREKLGGFYSIQQLLEINGIDAERFSEISTHFTIDPKKIKQMDINKSSFKDFTRHPYFEYYIVKAIFEYKDKQGRFTSIDDLHKIPLIYDDLYNKITPYICLSMN